MGGRMFWVLVVFFSGVLHAEIANVQVTGSTNVQAVLSYEAPAGSGCTVEISESPSLRPLVHDVDPALFPGSDSDARNGNANNGRKRVFVAGKRAVDEGADHKWYSRALQTDTVHHYRIRCGSETATGSFRTANLAVGTSYPWPIPQDPQTGNFRWPSFDTGDQRQTAIDPNYGTLIRRVTVPGEGGGTDWLNTTFRQAAGRNWTQPEASLTGGGVASYSSPGQNWLAITGANIKVLRYLITGQAVDSVVVRIRGSAQGANEADRRIDVCLTVDGATCNGEIRNVVLDTRQTTKNLGSPEPVDTWGAPLWEGQLQENTFGVLIRRSKPSGASISIGKVEMDIRNSGMGSLPENGFLTVCSGVKSNGGFHCAFRSFGGNGTNAMYWIQPETGEVRPLGAIVAAGWGGPPGQCASNWAAFDESDPNVYYCMPRNHNGSFLLKGTYTGNDVAAKAGDKAKIEWVNLTPEPHTIAEQVKSFNPDYDPAQFPCGLVAMAGNHTLLTCKEGFQDSIGWLAVFDLGNGKPLNSGGTGKIIAAAKSFASPNTRWCGIHATEHLSLSDWFGWGAERLTGHGARGTGPYSVKLLSPIPAQTGHMTVQVSGEPQPYLMDVQAGDIFQIMTRPGALDILRIDRKKSSTEWDVERFVPYGGQPVPVEPGARLDAFCNGVDPNNPKPGVQAYWNFIADPKGQDTTNTAWTAEKVLTGGHLTQRGDYRIMVDHRGYHIIAAPLPKSLNHPVDYTITANPRWDGVRAWIGLGDEKLEGLTNVYQGHPNYENFRAAGRNNWYSDLIPFIGSPGLTSGLSPVAGRSQVYLARGVRLHRGVFPTFALCGGRQLKDVSPGPISDSNSFSYCVGKDCVAGASPADTFVNCPPPAGPESRCLPFLAGSEKSVCVGDLPPYGQSVTQFFFDRSGIRNRVLTNGLFPWQSRLTPMPLSAAFSLPDGSWILFPSYGSSARRDVYMVKVPRQPEFDPDPFRWTKPVPVTISATPPPGGFARAVVQFGPTADLGSSAAMPACRSGSPCSVTIGAKPLEVVFSKVVFEDAGGKVLTESGMQVHISSGTLGPGIAPGS